MLGSGRYIYSALINARSGWDRLARPVPCAPQLEE